MTFSLISVTDPILHTKAEPVLPEELPRLIPVIAEMFSFMTEADGMGLAAPQIGISKRFFIAQYERIKLVCINPEITEELTEKLARIEGCLSYPFQTCIVPRAGQIKVRYQNENGTWKTPKFKDTLARIFAHETDHCDGIVMWNRT